MSSPFYHISCIVSPLFLPSIALLCCLPSILLLYHSPTSSFLYNILDRLHPLYILSSIPVLYPLPLSCDPSLSPYPLSLSSIVSPPSHPLSSILYPHQYLLSYAISLFSSPDPPSLVRRPLPPNPYSSYNYPPSVLPSPLWKSLKKESEYDRCRTEPGLSHITWMGPRDEKHVVQARAQNQRINLVLITDSILTAF